MVDLILRETNKYARQAKKVCYNYLHYATSNISYSQIPNLGLTKDELFSFLGIVIAMGVSPLPRLQDHWSRHPALNSPYITRNMINKRFRNILSSLHFNDTSNPDETPQMNREDPRYDPLYRVRPFLTLISQACRSNYQPHHSVCRQSYDKVQGEVEDKTIRACETRKIQIQVVLRVSGNQGNYLFSLFSIRCDSVNGYTYDFQIYKGKEKGTAEQGLGATVVMELCQPLLGNIAYFLQFENHFS